MGNWFGPSTRIKLYVRELRNGRTYSININDPNDFTIKTLIDQISQRIPDFPRDEMSLKFKKAELTNDGEKNISQVENLKNESNLFLERVDSRGGLARPWTINVKTLTGRVFNVEVSSPQDVCVLGLKLLIADESDIKPEEVRLIIDGKQMEDGTPAQPQFITAYPAICHDCTIHLVLK